MREFARDVVNLWRTGPPYFWLTVAAGYLIFTMLADWAVLHRAPTSASVAGEAARMLLAFTLGITWAVVIRRRKLRSESRTTSHSAH